MSYAFQQIKYFITNPKHKYLSEEALRKWPISEKMISEYILTAQLEGLISRERTKNGYKCLIQFKNSHSLELVSRKKKNKKSQLDQFLKNKGANNE